MHAALELSPPTGNVLDAGADEIVRLARDFLDR